MTDEQLTALWREIVRTAKPGARVIFRTAGEETILPGRVPDAILSRFAYDAAAGRAWTARDRSSIYGGFHLYTLKALMAMAVTLDATMPPATWTASIATSGTSTMRRANSICSGRDTHAERAAAATPAGACWRLAAARAAI